VRRDRTPGSGFRSPANTFTRKNVELRWGGGGEKVSLLTEKKQRKREVWAPFVLVSEGKLKTLMWKRRGKNKNPRRETRKCRDEKRIPKLSPARRRCNSTGGGGSPDGEEEKAMSIGGEGRIEHKRGITRRPSDNHNTSILNREWGAPREKNLGESSGPPSTGDPCKHPNLFRIRKISSWGGGFVVRGEEKEKVTEGSERRKKSKALGVLLVKKKFSL